MPKKLVRIIKKSSKTLKLIMDRICLEKNNEKCVGQKYFLSFKLLLFLKYQGYIRGLWVALQVIIKLLSTELIGYPILYQIGPLNFFKYKIPVN